MSKYKPSKLANINAAGNGYPVVVEFNSGNQAGWTHINGNCGPDNRMVCLTVEQLRIIYERAKRLASFTKRKTTQPRKAKATQ